MTTGSVAPVILRMWYFNSAAANSAAAVGSFARTIVAMGLPSRVMENPTGPANADVPNQKQMPKTLSATTDHGPALRAVTYELYCCLSVITFHSLRSLRTPFYTFHGARAMTTAAGCHRVP